MKITDAQISSAYRTSPKEVQELIEEGVLASLVESLSLRLSLTEEQGASLGLSLRNALIGLASPRDVEAELIGTGIAKEVVEKIVLEAKEKLFTPVEHSQETKNKSSDVSLAQVVPPDHLLPPHVEVQVKQVESIPRITTQSASVEIKQATPPEPAPPRTMASDVEAMQGGGKPSASRPVVPPRPVAPPRPVPPPTVAVVQEDLKKYGVDPYREPIQ